MNSAMNATLVLGELSAGDSTAAERLLPLVYDELRALAAGYLRQERPGHTLQPTALVHEAYVRLVGGSQPDWAGRAHFLAVAARAMRRTLVNHALARKAEKRGGGRTMLSLDPDSAPAPGGEIDASALSEALDRLEALDERKARVVEMRFFGGMTVEESAGVLGVSVSTVEGDWRFARAWLSKEMADDASSGRPGSDR
jgi:RNA polymerase sigma-70 factor, ECF subfamily